MENFAIFECKECLSSKFNSKFDWSFISLCFCINVKDRNDRLEQAKKQFHRVGLCHKIIYYRPEKDKTSYLKFPGKRGCWESHRACALFSLTCQQSISLIFEDDIMFIEDITPKHIKMVQYSLSKMERSWDILHLGCLEIISLPTKVPFVRRTFSWCFQSYFMNLRFMKFLKENPYDRHIYLDENGKKIGREIDLDTFSILNRIKMYCTHPLLTFQANSPTSIERQLWMQSIKYFVMSDEKNWKYIHNIGGFISFIVFIPLLFTILIVNIIIVVIYFIMDLKKVKINIK